MENVEKRFGVLLTPDIKIHRKYFSELCKLLGIQVIYYAVNPGQKYTSYAELETTHQAPELVGCIFDEHPTQQTLKKLKWLSELQEDASIIHVPYDLHDIQTGCLFVVPSGLDNADGRLFRVTKMSNIMIYPASIACEIVPEYTDTFRANKFDHSNNNFNILAEEDGY